jgi:flagellar biosynthesis protein FliR
MDLTVIGIERIQTFVLVLARTAGIFTLAPIFGSNQVPVQVRIAVAVALALVFVPMSTPGVAVAADILSMLVLVIKETVVGLAIGFVTILIFAAIQAAGDFIDVHAGFAFAAVIDPVFGAQTAIAGRLHQMIAGMLFFATNAHHILLRGLGDSFQLVPIGQLNFDPAVANGVLNLFASLFGIAVKIAAPVVAAVFLADLVLAILARVVPQMNVLIVGFPFKLGVGLVGTAIALPVAIALTRDVLGDIDIYTTGMLRLLSAVP